jgi:hypothetical protein
VDEKPKAEVAPDLTDLMSLGFLKPAAKNEEQPKNLEDSYALSPFVLSRL